MDTTETAIYKLRVEGQAEVERLTKSVNDAAAAEEKLGASSRTASQGLQNQIARMDPLVKANEAYRKVLETNLRYREAGKGTEEQLNAHLANGTRIYQERIAAIKQSEAATTAHANATQKMVATTVSATNATKLQRYEMINLGRQLQDVGVSLFSGQSFLTVGVQQGTQILDIAASSGVKVKDMFKQVGSAIGSAFTVTRVLTGGVIALGAAVAYTAIQWDDANKAMERSLIGPGSRTGTSVNDISKFAKDNATPTGMSVSEARNAAIEFTKTGEIQIAVLKGLGNAVHGYAVLTETEAPEASKKLAGVLSGDLGKAVLELSKTYSGFDAATRKQVTEMEAAGQKTAAQQVIIDKMAAANLKAADSVGVMTKAWTAFKNIAGEIANPSPPQRESPQEKIDTLNSRQAEFAAGKSPFQNEKGFGEAIAKEKAIAQKALDSLNAEKATAELANLSMASDAFARSITPQIDQIEALNIALGKLKEARDKGVGGANVDAAIQAATNQKQLLIESQAEAARYNEQVAAISKSWGDVGQAAALVLQTAQNQLPVIEAVGGAEKMAAQYAADYANAKEKGKTAAEATALAASNLQAAEAAVNASAKETLWNLQNQYQVAAARNGAEQNAAQQTATYNKLVHDGVNKQTASEVAAQERINKEVSATRRVYMQINELRKTGLNLEGQIGKLVASEDVNSANMLLTVNARAAGDIAYMEAMQSGASSSAAAALSVATVANYMDKAATAAAQYADQMLRASDAANEAAVAQARQNGASSFTLQKNAFGDFNVQAGTQYTSEGGDPRYNEMLRMRAATSALGVQGEVEQAYASGNISAALKAVMDAPNMSGADPATAALAAGKGYDLNAILGAPTSNIGNKISAYDSLVQLQNAQTKDPLAQAGNLEKELAWLQTLPKSLAGDQKMADLQDSIDQLKSSTDSLTKSNQDLLSPYYTQDPRTSHIGFRSQGMASTGYIDIPGTPSANDNMTLTLPVASGERVSVGNGPNRGGKTVHITNNITIGAGANVDQFKRTLFQANQNAQKQLAATR